MATILVVDDQTTIRRLVCNVLTSMGHDASEANSGIQALSLCEVQRFDLLILDYRMPGMDGLEVAEHLQGKVRFILHTSDYGDKALVCRALNLGALAVIAKISDVSAFKKEIERLLSI